MYLRSTINMHQILCLVIFIFVNSAGNISAQAPTNGPFVIFQPGEYFDPFTEPSKDHRPSASITSQPTSLYSETNNDFIQPFWNLPSHSAPNSYPRTVAQTSGSAAQVDAQISQPNVFEQLSTSFSNKPKTSNTQLNSKAFNRAPKGYPRTIAYTSGSAAQVDAQIRQPSAQIHTPYKRRPQAKNAQLKTVNNKPKAFNRAPTAQASGNAAHVDAPIRRPSKKIPYEAASLKEKAAATEHHIKTVNDNLKTLRRLTSQTKKDYGAPKVPRNRNSGYSVSEDGVAEPSALVAEASGHSASLVGQTNEVVAHPSHHAASRSHGDGQSHEKDHHKSDSDKDVKDYKSNHHHDTKDFEKHDDHNKKAHHGEKGGHHNEHHDEAGHYKKHHEGKKSHKAAKFGEKKGHKRGHKTKGYHNKFHRDEYHREHRFYDDYNKEGHHEKHGDAHSHYKKKKGGHKNEGGHKSGHSSKEHGKKGYSDKGSVEEDHKGFDKEGGRKKYHKHHKDYHKKRGSSKGGKYGYKKEH